MSTSVLDIPVKKITGEPTTLAEFKGHVLLVVNVASKCGLTPQYEGLEKDLRAVQRPGTGRRRLPRKRLQAAGARHQRRDPSPSAPPTSASSSRSSTKSPSSVRKSIRSTPHSSLPSPRPSASAKSPCATSSKATASRATPSRRSSGTSRSSLSAATAEVVKRFAPDTQPDAPELTAAIEVRARQKLAHRDAAADQRATAAGSLQHGPSVAAAPTARKQPEDTSQSSGRLRTADRPMMLVHNPLSTPIGRARCPIALGRHERRKQPIERRLLHAAAGVGNRHRHPFVAGSVARRPHRTIMRRAAVQRIQRIVHQVRHHLLNLARKAQYLRRFSVLAPQNRLPGRPSPSRGRKAPTQSALPAMSESPPCAAGRTSGCAPQCARSRCSSLSASSSKSFVFPAMLVHLGQE